MDKFKNKYRIPSARLPNWDYANDGAYFITICTTNRQHFFGECINDKMSLTTAGIIVQGLWYDIPNHSPTVELGEFVVMPNHVHGILILNSPQVETLPATSDGDDDGGDKNDGNVNQFFSDISPKSGSVSRIIGSYKSSCTRHINLAFPDLNFGWQTRFWDNIIRSDQSFETISDYIVNNPKNWKDDKFFNE